MVDLGRPGDRHAWLRGLVARSRPRPSLERDAAVGPRAPWPGHSSSGPRRRASGPA